MYTKDIVAALNRLEQTIRRQGRKVPWKPDPAELQDRRSKQALIIAILALIVSALGIFW